MNISGFGARKRMFLSFFFFGCAELAPGILVPQPGIEPKAPESEGPCWLSSTVRDPGLSLSVAPNEPCDSGEVPLPVSVSVS